MDAYLLTGLARSMKDGELSGAQKRSASGDREILHRMLHDKPGVMPADIRTCRQTTTTELSASP